MDMNISKYMAFVTTVEYGSFTKAAEILNYSQSAVSRMIGDLENEWQISLLERSKSGVRLTSDGLKLLPYAKKLCEEYKNLQIQVSELGGLKSGIIRIGTFSSVATHWLPNIIKEFQKDYPNIDYEILLGDCSEIENWITEGRVDCGFILMPSKTGLETIFLEQDDFIAVLPTNHPLASKEKISASDLCDDPFLLLQKSDNTEIYEIFERSGMHPKVHFITWDDYAIMSMVETGLGISVLPRLILRRIPYRLVLKEFNVPTYRSICLAMRSKKTMSLATRKFIEYLKYR